MKCLILALCAAVVGCGGGKTFTDLGNGVAVPAEHIESYAPSMG